MTGRGDHALVPTSRNVCIRVEFAMRAPLRLAMLIVVALAVAAVSPLQADERGADRAADTDPIAVESLVADLELFRTVLLEAHPGLLRYQSRDDFEHNVRQARAAISAPLSRHEFYLLLQPIVAAIRDGHTKFHPDTVWSGYAYFNRDRQIPLRLHVVGTRAWSLWSGPGSPVPTGAEILAIDGRPMSEILATLWDRSTFVDGTGPGARRLDVGDLFPAYYGNFVDAADSFEVRYRLAGGTGVEATRLAALPAEDVEAAHRRGDDAIELSFPDDGVALLRVPSFAPAAGARAFRRDLGTAFESIRDAGTERLIIDLRDNEGGTDSLGAHLFSYIADGPFRYYERIDVTRKRPFSVHEHVDVPWFFGFYRALIRRDADRFVWPHKSELREQRPARDAFAGEVVVLINGRTFSVGAEFAAIARSTGRVRFAGEETGGAYGGNTSGFFAIARLPASGLIAGIPLWGYHLAVEPIQPLDRGVIPDLVVVPTIDDILAGRDPVLEAALGM